MADAPRLTPEQVRKVARLARLDLPDDQVARAAERLDAVLGYVERLAALDLDGVEPLTHVGGEVNRLDDDVPAATLPPEAVARLAPESFGPFIRVPKVIGDGGNA
ncbi:MAG: Asp-tRNA(Asn)/Glu-tRNA(Gln) amidotransferase subunit GatC [Phycisphaeraceae bacterium]|nr:Asp-tRNA(Asn)/Glu-tRNA(Gln) amidotransferase subunit GatC [Phycisphaeraceae bacterium]